MAEEISKKENSRPRILRGPESKSPKIMKTLGEVFFEWCERDPDKIFQVSYLRLGIL